MLEGKTAIALQWGASKGKNYCKVPQHRSVPDSRQVSARFSRMLDTSAPLVGNQVWS